MPDWTKPMQQTFEYYTIDPGTWSEVSQIQNVEASTIERDSESETLGSATIDLLDSIGEQYVRIYLVTIQNGVKERHPLATVLVQNPMFDFDGKVRKNSADAYTPLLELKDNQPPIGYALLKDESIMATASRLVRENARAPVVAVNDGSTLQRNFVADTEDTWLSFVKDLIAEEKYSFALDEMGNILFSPHQDLAALQPVWVYDDGNSSILYPEISIKSDVNAIPNVVEVTYSNGPKTIFSRVVNDDPNSPASTVNRGRIILYRERNPKLNSFNMDYDDTDVGGRAASQSIVDDYAKQLLREKSTIECTLSYKHGYCGTRLGDCVLLNYKRAGLTDVKAKIISQSISCVPGCPVTEKAVFTKKLWG